MGAGAGAHAAPAAPTLLWSQDRSHGVMVTLSHGGFTPRAHLAVLLDAGQLGGRLEEVVHRVLALEVGDLGQVIVLEHSDA